jgi:DegV family protein with EDD domain
VRVVVDSTADLLPSFAQVLGIIVVPNRVLIDGQVLRDGVDISPSQFFARLPKASPMPRTEPVTPQDLYEAYQMAFSHGATDIVSIHVSSRLSLAARHAAMARDALGGAPIQIIDSLQAGIGMWPAVTEAAKLANVGATAQEVCAMAQSVLARTRVYFMVASLEYMRRNGRIGRAREVLGTLLDAHPILTLSQGEVVPVETVRPRTRAMARMCDLALSQGPVDALLMCGSSADLMGAMETLLQGRYQGTLHQTWLGPTIGANIGPAAALAVTVR